MEYQQFINFLKKEKEYDFFLKIVNEHPRNSFCNKQNLKELYEDNLFIRDIFIFTVISLFNINEHCEYVVKGRLVNLHLKWYNYYHHGE